MSIFKPIFDIKVYKADKDGPFPFLSPTIEINTDGYSSQNIASETEVDEVIDYLIGELQKTRKKAKKIFKDYKKSIQDK